MSAVERQCITCHESFTGDTCPRCSVEPTNVIDPDALCTWPGCEIGTLDAHTFREFREHNPELLRPADPVPPMPNGEIALGLVVKACVISLDDVGPGERRHHPALSFTFYGVDGKTEIGSYTLIGDGPSLRSLRPIVASAIDGALTAARRKRG